MSTKVDVHLRYDPPRSVLPPDYIQQETISLSLNFSFTYKYETALRDVHGRPIVITLNTEPHISPCFSCPIHPRLMARNQDLSVLCSYLLNFLNSRIPNVNNTSRLYVAQKIADSLKTTAVFPLCQVRADVEIVQHRNSWIHHHHQHDGDVGDSTVIKGGETGASKLALDELMEEGRFNYHNGGSTGEGQECSFCWDNYKEDDTTWNNRSELGYLSN
ncbi:hypothetical protein M5689_023447 [Euphorbia peplus]|nr:hypothetical protein M5689_023447 [Euphorbia peplus]